MTHEGEKWQVYAPNGEPIEGSWWDAALDNPENTGSDAIVGVSVVFVFRVNEQGLIEVLWQRRSDKVSRHPGMWDISAGGHINLGESLVEGAVRELREEIGAIVDVQDLRFVTMRPFNKNRFAWIYAVDFTGRTEDFSFSDDEVSEVKWIPYDEMTEFRKKFAKKPLQKDKLTFKMLEMWFLQHGYLQAE